MAKWKGNIIANTPAISSGTPSTGRADGLWGLNFQLQQKQANLWAKGIYAPIAPTSVVATLTSKTTATVTFTAPTDTGSSPITSYTVTRYPDNVTTTVTTTSASITGLSLDITYTFTVTATSLHGTSTASSVSNSITPALNLGDSYAGGYYAGKISINGDGVATHLLIVAPKATGQASGKTFGNYGTDTGFKSRINGPSNSAGEAALGAGNTAAVFCENLTIGGYSDWYMPAINELEVLYYYFKPSSSSNYAGGTNGANPNAVAPEPINTKYTASAPAQTSITPFNSTEAFDFNTTDASKFYLTSTDLSSGNSWLISFNNGQQDYGGKLNNYYVRAVRRIPI